MQNLRFLFLATRDWYNPKTTGGDNTLWEYARYLAAAGHLVTFVAAKFPGSPAIQELAGMRVVRLGSIHTMWILTFLYYMRHCRNRYDLVITEGFGGSRIPRLTPLYVREPIVTSWHQVHRDLFAAQYPKVLVWPLSAFERVTAWVHRNTWVQAYTPEWKQAFTTIGFQKNKIFVVPVSIRDEWLVNSQRAQALTKTFVWIGKFRRYKCPHHVIAAMRQVVDQVHEARLLLIGRHDDLRYEAQLRSQIAHLGLESNVEFCFNVGEEEKLDLLRSARALVLPSSVEGFGIVVLEANACGIPVVASTGVPASVVTEGRNGLRYAFGDIGQLAERMMEVLMDDELYSRLSSQSIAFASTFRWQDIGARYESALNLVLAEAGRSRPD